MSSSYAQKYGHLAPQELQPDEPPQISGLTPLDPINPTLVSFSSDTHRRAEIERHQRRYLAGFTTQELEELDAVTSRTLRKADLEIDIMDWITRDKWSLVPDTRIPYDDGTGMWEASDDETWKLLVPILKLVTHIIAKLDEHPFYDAFFWGEREQIPAHRFFAADILTHGLQTLQNKYEILRMRPPIDRGGRDTPLSAGVLIADIFQPYLRLGIYTRTASPRPNNVTTSFGSEANAMTINLGRTVPDTGYYEMWISVQNLSVLRRNDLTDLERAAANVHNATTIVHEFMHAMHMADNYAKMSKPEPFFEEGAVSEIGYDLETAIFGGVPTPIWEPNIKIVEVPMMGMMMRSYPAPTSVIISGEIELDNPSVPHRALRMPLPVNYLEALLHPNFWEANFATAGVLRPAPPLAMTWKPRGSSTWHMAINSMQVQSLFQRYNDLTPVTEALALKPGERRAWANVFNATNVKTMYDLIQARSDETKLVIDQIELCEVRKATSSYTNSVRSLLPRLEALIIAHDEVVNFLPTLELRSQNEYSHIRNGCQSFNRSVRQVIQHFDNTGDAGIDMGLAMLVQGLEKSRLKLVPDTGPAASGINAATNAVSEMMQSDLDDDQRFIDAFTAYQNNDIIGLRNICDELILGFGVNIYLQSMARALMAFVDTIPLQDRIDSLQRALNTLRDYPIPERWQIIIQGPIQQFEAVLLNLQFQAANLASPDRMIRRCCKRKFDQF